MLHLILLYTTLIATISCIIFLIYYYIRKKSIPNWIWYMVLGIAILNNVETIFKNFIK